MNSCLKVFGLVTGEQKIAVWLSSLPYVTASVQNFWNRWQPGK